MIWIYKYDEEYVWQPGEEILVDLENGDEIPEGYTSIQPQNGLYIAKFDPDKEEWFESATQEYIDGLQPVIQPSEIEILRQQHAELVFTLMMGGVI
ncbi:phage like protein [Bacillus pumilus]|nr:phage like protein [Bacillus pumilus]